MCRHPCFSRLENDSPSSTFSVFCSSLLLMLACKFHEHYNLPPLFCCEFSWIFPAVFSHLLTLTSSWNHNRRTGRKISQDEVRLKLYWLKHLVLPKRLRNRLNLRDNIKYGGSGRQKQTQGGFRSRQSKVKPSIMQPPPSGLSGFAPRTQNHSQKQDWQWAGQRRTKMLWV